MPHTTELVCSNSACGRTFAKLVGEITRQRKRGRERFYCSVLCGTRDSNKKTRRKGNVNNFHGVTRRNALTPFRWFVARARARIKYGAVGVTPQSLKELWDVQRGLCPFTGWTLILPHSTYGWIEGASHRNASLDRVDNSKGYVDGNVRFIALMANLARCDFTDDDVIDFCHAVAKNHVRTAVITSEITLPTG